MNMVLFCVNVLIFTFAGLVAGVLPVMFWAIHFAGTSRQPPRVLEYVLLLIFSATLTAGFVFGVWFARKQSRKQFWRLTDTELTCGRSRPQSLPLARIEKIIEGLPTDALAKLFRRAKPGTVAGTSLAVLSTVDPRWNTVKGMHLVRAQKENSLLICFRYGSWLPLRLYLLPNGTAIMDALKERFKDRLIQSCDYY